MLCFYSSLDRKRIKTVIFQREINYDCTYMIKQGQGGVSRVRFRDKDGAISIHGFVISMY